MTTIPGHNIIIQQSATAQELINQTTAHKISPEQAAALQAANEIAKSTTIQKTEESERLKEKKALRKKQLLEKKRKKTKKDKKGEDPEITGRLLDTTV